MENKVNVKIDRKMYEILSSIAKDVEVSLGRKTSVEDVIALSLGCFLKEMFLEAALEKIFKGGVANG